MKSTGENMRPTRWLNRLRSNGIGLVPFIVSIIFFGNLLSVVGCSSRRSVESVPELIGQSLPRFRGESLDGRLVRFPDEIRGRSHLLLVAYVQEAQFDVDRWVLGVLQAKASVRIIELPTISGLGAQLAKGFINRGMQQGIPREDWASIVTVYGDAESLRSYVGEIPGNNACVLLIDSKGVIRWAHRNGYSPRELLELVSVAQSLDSNKQ
jgi:hypothetical protein